ncbi:DNA-directed RNA polymerase I subunit RPA43-like [Amphibalanus amphitrite]|uniref:DNA-directed RNA polymerase I subunit RPA43-like n=1 Tax=Amphibalanus amphitrite TaxID=1232801 RepID=UPI001C915AD5|nr:DNA-directed RNA polymerase I subunit RPA43-like [Amphibalanus amphitrite]
MSFDRQNTAKVPKIESVPCPVNNESNIPFLRELAGKKGTFIEKITDTMHIGLLPSMLGKLRSGIVDNLNSMLPKYVPQLNGIMVGYENLAMLGSKGHMIPGYHHIHINIRADFYVFKPVIGGTLTGTVLKKSSSSVTCLTNKVFTVFVVLPAHMKRSLHKIQIHDEISFTIEKIDLLSQIPFVKGILNDDSLPSGSSSHVRFDSESAEPDSGLSSIEDGSLGRSPAESAETPHSRKHKKRRRDREEAEGEEPPVAEEPAPAEEEPARRKSKKRRREDDDQVNGEEASPRKAKKRHRSEPEPEPVVEELYLADPVPPTSSLKKKKKRKEQADLNGSISGMLR